MQDWKLEEMLGHQDFSPALQNVERIRDLRTLLKATQGKMERLEKDPTRNKELILRERIILEATQREIQRLERKSLAKELGGE